jgi:hypothetical protein
MDRLPRQRAKGIAHDYRIDITLLRIDDPSDHPVEVAAIVDWELALHPHRSAPEVRARTSAGHAALQPCRRPTRPLCRARQNVRLTWW